MPKIANPAGKGPAKRAPEPSKPVVPITWMRILEDRQVPRTGGNYMIRAGKELPSCNYDFAALKRAGVKLEPCDPPHWYVDAQLRAVQRHEELEAAGVEGLPETYDPTAPDAPSPTA